MRLSTLLTAAALSVAATGAFAATVKIDDFSGNQTVIAPGFGTFAPTDTGAFAGAIGGNRTITASGDGAAFPAATTVSIASGVASVGNGPGVTGTGLFEWNAGGADLVDGTNTMINLNVLSSDLTVSYALTVNGTSVTQSPISPTGTLSFKFTDFGGVDFTNVGAISLFVAGPTSFDASFDLLVAAVPLPGGAALAFGGLAALGAVRSRRRRKAA